MTEPEENSNNSHISIKKPIAEFHSEKSRRIFRSPNSVKFDDDLKEKFLEDLAVHGKAALACRTVGINITTYRDHIKKDEDFKQAVDDTIEILNGERASQIEREALAGAIREQFNGKGEKVGEQVVYETKLREMILKRSDPAYREAQQHDVNVSGGCLVIPGVPSLADWENTYSPAILQIQKEQALLEQGSKNDED